MRSIIFSLLLLGVVCFANTKNEEMTQENLNGTWVPISLEINGQQLPKESFEKQRLIINDSTYTFIAESVDKGTLTYKGGKMDIYGKDGVNAGKHFTSIYKYQGEFLTICYNLTGDKYPDSYESKGRPNYFLAVFKKTDK